MIKCETLNAKSLAIINGWSMQLIGKSVKIALNGYFIKRLFWEIYLLWNPHWLRNSSSLKCSEKLIRSNFLINFWNVCWYTSWLIVCFLQAGIASECFNLLGNSPRLQQFKYGHMKLLNKPILSFMIFVGMSLSWQVLWTFSFSVILWTYFHLCS